MTIEELIHKNYSTYIRFDKNKPLFVTDDSFKGMYFLDEGRVKVFSNNSSGKVFLWYVSKGELLGISSYFNDYKKYSFSAIADSKEVKTLFIPKEDIKKIILENENVKNDLIKKLCTRIKATEDRLFSLKNDPVKTRIAKAFKLLLRDVLETSKVIKLSFSEDELALLAGTSKKYIKKVLEEYQSRKILKIQNQVCLVYDPKLLING